MPSYNLTHAAMAEIQTTKKVWTDRQTAFQLYIVDDGTKWWPSDKANHSCGCKLLYIIQVKGFSWPYLISKILIAYNYSYNAASD